MLEKNNNTVPKEIAPTVAVSSELNKYPIIIPNNMNTVVINSIAADTLKITDAIVGLIEIITLKTMINCTIIIKIFVRYVANTNKKLFVGLMKFLK